MDIDTRVNSFLRNHIPLKEDTLVGIVVLFLNGIIQPANEAIDIIEKLVFRAAFLDTIVR